MIRDSELERLKYSIKMNKCIIFTYFNSGGGTYSDFE